MTARTCRRHLLPHPWRPEPAQCAIGLALLAALAGPAPVYAATGLKALSLEQLLDVPVLGASKYEQRQGDVAAAVSVITRQEIKAFGWRTLAQALASLPGMHTTYDRQYEQLGTRGFGVPGDFNTRVLVTVNGNRLNDTVYDGGAVGRQFPLDMDLIERIEFIPGPGGAVYGQNAMLGVVNVVTRAGAGLGGAELAAAYQSPQALREGRASWGKVLDNGIDVVLSVSGMHARGEDRFFDFGAAGVSGVAAGLDGERAKQFFARIGGGPWSLDFVHGDRVKSDPTGGYHSDPLVAGQYQGDRYSVAQLQYQDELAGGTAHVSARLFMGQQRYSGTWSYGTLFYGGGLADWYGTEVRLLSTAWAGHKLMVGLELQDNVRQDLVGLDLANPGNDIRIPGSGYRVGLYAQDEWRLSDTLTTTLGARVDRNDTSGAKLSPRAALIWQATAATTFKALYGRAHRAPNVFERDYGDGVAIAANPGLIGERIDTLELVATHQVGRDLALRGSIYRWTMHDLIEQGVDPVSGLSQYQCGGKVEARGLELSADKTWASGTRLRGSVSYQHLANAGGDVVNAPRVLGKLNASGPLPVAGLRVGYELQYDSPRLAIAGERLGGYAVSNLYLSSTALASGLELSMSVRNLLDKRYAHPGAASAWQDALEQDGRSVRVKLDYKF